MAKKTIVLTRYNAPAEEERVANATITPGMLLDLMSTNKFRAHPTADVNAPAVFAVEDDHQGNDIDDNYSADDLVRAWIPRRGDWVLAILADGENVAIGDLLSSNGDGYLKKHVAETESWGISEAGTVTVYPLQIVAEAREAIDISDSSGAESSGTLGYNRRIKVRIV